MKKFIFIILFTLIGFTVKAQYYGYSPYLYAQIAAETNEAYQLNNIRFDENAIKKNPAAWSAYETYLSLNATYGKALKTYSIVSWSGVGAMGISLIPLCLDYGYDDRRSVTAEAIGYSLLGIGGLTACVGLIGMAFQIDKHNINKKEFIYYLKTTNNGIGIVSIF